MARCAQCATAYFTDTAADLGKRPRADQGSHRQYGADLRDKLAPLLAIDRPRNGRLLDVECGSGFLPHFWKTSGFGEGIGVESDEDAQISAHKLGANVLTRPFRDAAELHDHSFDYVCSFDEIERAKNPEAFVNELASALAANGILILTTPSASALEQGASNGVLLSILAPGYRNFVASREGLESLLRRCGFDNVLVRDSGQALSAWASHQPLPDIADAISDSDVYLDYLSTLFDNADTDVAISALHLAVKETFDRGRFEDAERYHQQFTALANEHLGFDLEDFQTAQQQVKTASTIEGNAHPRWLGSSMLYAGLLAKHMDAGLGKQAALFSGAISALQSDIEQVSQFSYSAFEDITRAKQEHRDVFEKMREVAPAKPDSNQIYLLRRPAELSGKDVCLFSIYAPSGQISPATVAYVETMAKHGFSVIACVALDDPTAYFDTSSLSAASGIVIRQNGGMDFASWSSALRLLPECWSAARLAFTNDSVLVLPNLMKPFLDRVRNLDEDFLGLTESFELSHHAQTYFFVFQRAALKNTDVRAFWEGIHAFENKTDIIKTYELKLLSHVKEDWGLSHSFLFSMADILPDASHEDYEDVNVSHFYWEHLVSLGMPFVKVELVRDNPFGLKILHWPSVFRREGASVELAMDHLSIRKSVLPKPPPPEEKPQRSEWRMVLSDIARVPRNSRRRRKARKSGEAE